MVVAANPTPASAIQVLAPVDFHGRHLELIGRDGEPYVPMKPFVEAMGLVWSPQLRRLTDEPDRFCTTMMVVQMPGDDQKREITCIPLSRLPAWMGTLQTSRMGNPEAVRIVKLFQAESDAVLWHHWKQGASRPEVEPLPVPTVKPLAVPVGLAVPTTLTELWVENLKLHMQCGQILLEQERQIAAHKVWQEAQEKRDDEIVDAVNAKFADVDTRVLAMENARQEAVDLLYTFPKPLLTPEELTTRARIRNMVQAYARANGGCYKETWQRLYEMFNFDWHTNINGTKTRLGLSKTIEAVEVMGKLDELESSAFKLLCDPLTGAITRRNIFLAE